jgi:hypothetical protein
MASQGLHIPPPTSSCLSMPLHVSPCLSSPIHASSSNFYASPYISMPLKGLHASSCFSMPLHASSCLPMPPHASSCLAVPPRPFSFPPMPHHASPCLHMPCTCVPSRGGSKHQSPRSLSLCPMSFQQTGQSIKTRDPSCFAECLFSRLFTAFNPTIPLVLSNVN